jgi:hypothetical protein
LLFDFCSSKDIVKKMNRQATTEKIFVKHVSELSKDLLRFSKKTKKEDTIKNNKTTETSIS